MGQLGAGRRAPREADIQAMFDGVAIHYDLLNGLLSLGLDRWWRWITARAIRSHGATIVLDVGCGTGKLARLVALRSRVVGVDISIEMLRRASRSAGRGVALVQGSAFRLPFADAAFDCAVSGFVLRNLNDLPAAFAELARVMSPGGRVALLDITEPRRALVRYAFDAYFGTVAPALGRLAGRPAAYRYLAGSVGHLPPTHLLTAMLAEAGFAECSARPLTGGVVSLFTAVRRTAA